MRYYQGRAVVVTGGSSGIGLSLSRMLRSFGADVTIVARNAQRLQSAREVLLETAGSGKLSTIALDIGDGAAVSEALSGVQADMLINNAGITLPGRFGQLPVEEFQRQMRTNYLGAVHCTHALLPSLVGSGRGHIAFTASVVGFVGIYGYSAYAPTKFALQGFAECLRCELRPSGVRVSVCYPPDTDTPQHEFEQKHLPEETRRISGNAKLMSADAVARCMLEGMAAGRLEILPNRSTWMIHCAQRIAPRLVRFLMDADVQSAQRARGPKMSRPWWLP